MISSFKQNLPEKIMAFVCALLIYFYVVADKNPVMTQSYVVPVSVNNLPDDYNCELQPTEVSVRVSGPKNLLNKISVSSLRASISGDTLREGEVAAPVHLNIPQSITQQLDLVIQPETVKALVTRIGKRQMPVECLFVNTPESGYVYSKPVLNPDQVVVSGPSDLLKKAKRLVVSAVPNRPGAALDEELPVMVVDAKNRPINGLTMRPNMVRVIIALSPRQLSVSARVYPQLMGQPADGYEVARIIADPAEVLVNNGSESDTGNVIYTEPISVEGLNQSFTTNVKLKVAPGTSLVGSDEVRVEIQIHPKTAHE